MTIREILETQGAEPGYFVIESRSDGYLHFVKINMSIDDIETEYDLVERHYTKSIPHIKKKECIS